MSIQTQTFTANGTFTVPTTLVGTTVQFTTSGGRGTAFPGQTAAAQITGQLPITPTQRTFLVVIGHDASVEAGGAGFSGGGGGGGWAHGNRDPFFGGAGGGSTAILVPPATLYVEAGGGDGATRYFGSGTPGSYTGMSGQSIYPGGTGGGYSSNPPPQGQNRGLGAGSGGSQGGNGGNGFSFGTAGGGIGHGGGTNGANGLFNASGPAAGSGGLTMLGAGACFADPTVVSATYGRANVATAPQAIFSYHVADAPAAPLLLAPAANGFLDAHGAGVTFQGSYQAPSVDTGVLSAVVLSQQVGTGPLHYWNGTDFSSTTPVAVTPTSGGGALSGEPFTVVVPPAALANGVAYIWTMACTESLYGLQGPFAPAQSFTAVAPPTATITNPVGTVASVTPTVSWTNTTPSGTQQSYRYLIYTAPQNVSGIAPPPPGAIYDSGVVASSATSFVLPAGILRSVESYYGYLQIVNSAGAIPSLWTAAPFTVSLVSANAVTLSVTSGIDPASGMPAPRLVMTMTGADALGSAWFQANYGNGFVDIIAGLQPIVSGGATVYDLGAPFNQAISYRVRAAGVLIGNQVLTAWSATANLALPGIVSNYWWVVPPTSQASAMQITRLPGTAATTTATSGQTITQPTMPAGLTPSLTVEEWEQQGIFRGFGRKTAVVVHGDIWQDEFDLSLYFADPTSFDNFADIREIQGVLLFKSDMEGSFYWVTLGPDFNPGIMRETGRRKSPRRALVVHCTPTDPYVPDNPFVPT